MCVCPNSCNNMYGIVGFVFLFIKALLKPTQRWQHIIPGTRVALGEPWWINHNIDTKSTCIQLPNSPPPFSQELGSSTGRAVTPELWMWVWFLLKFWDFFLQSQLGLSLYTSVIGLNISSDYIHWLWSKDQWRLSYGWVGGKEIFKGGTVSGGLPFPQGTHVQCSLHCC